MFEAVIEYQRSFHFHKNNCGPLETENKTAIPWKSETIPSVLKWAKVHFFTTEMSICANSSKRS